MMHMKKIFTLFLLAVGFAMQASAQIEFIYEDKVVPDGSELNVYAKALEIAPGFSLISYEEAAPFIKNTGSQSTTVSVTLKKDNADDLITWCGITDQCSPIGAGTKTSSRSAKVGAGESVSLAAHVSFDEGDYKTVSFEVTASGGGVTRTIHMNVIYADATGISGAQVENAVKVAGKQLNYNFADNTERTLSVYSPTGRLVKEAHVQKNGSLSLAGLYKGIYLYAVTENGRRVATHKFILK